MLSESRCAKCRSYRTHLRVKRIRADHCEESVKVAHDSHAKYANLPRESLVERLKNTQKEKRSLKAKNTYLSGKLEKILKQEGMKLSKEESEDCSRLMDELTPVVEQDFDSDTPQRILWQEQIKYNQLKKKQQMRWYPLIIHFTLNLLYSSRAAYHAVTSSGFISLPSERTLRDYSHWCKVGHGVSFEFIQEAERLLQQEGINIKENEQPFVLLLDEMKVESGLVFNKNTGELIGFSNLGEVNQDIEHIISRMKNTPYTPPLAKKMLAFMIRPVHRPSFGFIVATFPTSDISGSQLFPVIWEVIEALELSSFSIIAVVVDGASPNCQFFKLCSKKGKGNVPYKTKNPYANRNIYFICDPPHLIKTTRNCLSNSHAHKKSRELQVL